MAEETSGNRIAEVTFRTAMGIFVAFIAIVVLFVL